MNVSIVICRGTPLPPPCLQNIEMIRLGVKFSLKYSARWTYKQNLDFKGLAGIKSPADTGSMPIYVRLLVLKEPFDRETSLAAWANCAQRISLRRCQEPSRLRKYKRVIGLS